MSTKKTKPKTNPAPSGESVTVRLPKEMPKGIEFRFDEKGEYWHISSKKGLKAFGELLNRGVIG